jgi:hypothetical protein
MFSVNPQWGSQRAATRPAHVLSNNLLQAGIIYTLQMHRVFEQMAMG